MRTAHFEPDLTSAQGVRRLVEDELEQDPVGEDALFQAQLLATELVTNAVRHAQSPVELTVARRQDRIRIEARDHSTARPSLPDDDTTRHKGLLLVEDLSEAWGVDVQDQNGKVVWCEVLTT